MPGRLMAKMRANIWRTLPDLKLELGASMQGVHYSTSRQHYACSPSAHCLSEPRPPRRPSACAIHVFSTLAETGCLVFGFNVPSKTARREPTSSSLMTRLQQVRQHIFFSAFQIALRMTALDGLSQ